MQDAANSSQSWQVGAYLRSNTDQRKIESLMRRGKGMIPHTEAMEKLMSVRHYCFVRGVVGRKPDGDCRDLLFDIHVAPFGRD